MSEPKNGGTRDRTTSAKIAAYGSIATAIIAAIGTIIAVALPIFVNQVANQTTATFSIGLTSTANSWISTTEAPSPILTATETLEIGDLVETLDVEATIGQATTNAGSTLSARATQYALQTQVVFDQTATAILWTDTPTPTSAATNTAMLTNTPPDTPLEQPTETDEPDGSGNWLTFLLYRWFTDRPLYLQIVILAVVFIIMSFFLGAGSPAEPITSSIGFVIFLYLLYLIFLNLAF